MIEIKTIGGTVLYVSKEAKNVRAALEEAVGGGAYLGGANLGGAYLGGAYLDGAYLGGAYLGGANLGGAYLGGANLGGANLGGANLDGAYLGGAYLDGAYLGGANLDGAVWKDVATLLHTAITSMNDSGRHWIQGTERRTLEDGSTAYCSIGSVNAQAATTGTTRAIAIWLLNSVAGGSIVSFNDFKGTTWEDVQAVFAVAIKHAERFAAGASSE